MAVNSFLILCSILGLKEMCNRSETLLLRPVLLNRCLPFLIAGDSRGLVQSLEMLILSSEYLEPQFLDQ